MDRGVRLDSANSLVEAERLTAEVSLSTDSLYLILSAWSVTRSGSLMPLQIPLFSHEKAPVPMVVSVLSGISVYARDRGNYIRNMRQSDMAPHSVGSRILDEQVRLLYRQSPLLLGGILTLIVATNWFLWDQVPRAHLLTWAAANIALVFARLILSLLFHRKDRNGREALRWAHLATAASALSGLLWGSVAIWALDTQSAPNVVYIVTILTAMTAASLVALSAWLPAYYAYSSASALLLCFSLLATGNSTFILLAVLILALVVVHLFLVNMLNRNLVETLNLRFDNLSLVERLTQQKELAERANSEKSRFLAAASHDLRQPLHALDLFLESVSKTRDGARKQELLDRARLSSRTLGELLNSLLDVSNLETGAIVPHISTFRVASLLDELAAEYENPATESDLSIRVYAPKYVVRSDPTLLKRMIRNLVSNAVKYTKAGGVLIGGRRRGNWLRIEVWDSGAGIPASEHGNIFSEFYQIDNPSRDRSKGIGLGLSIVQRLSRLLNHPVSLVSRAGQGSCFRVSVPLAQVTADSTVCEPVNNEFDLSGIFVVVVDDEQPIRDSMRALLRGWDCEVLVADGIQSTMSQLGSAEYQKPDVIIADYRLADNQTGLDLIAAIRGHFQARIPAVVATGDTALNRNVDIRSIDARVLFKPVTAQSLRSAIVEVVSTNSDERLIPPVP